MNSKEFYYKVREMRAAQRAYFKNRTQGDLERAKSLERIIDDEIKRVDDTLAPKQTSLNFDENGVYYD